MPKAGEKQVIKGICTASFGRVRKGFLSTRKLLRAATEGLSRLLSDEIRRVASYLASEAPRTSKALMSFSWSNLYEEFQLKCPHLLTFLSLMQPRKRRGKQQLFILLVVAILAKVRNKNAHLVQLLISLILLYGHTASQVRNCSIYIVHVLALLLIYGIEAVTINSISMNMTLILTCT